MRNWHTSMRLHSKPSISENTCSCWSMLVLGSVSSRIFIDWIWGLDNRDELSWFASNLLDSHSTLLVVSSDIQIRRSLDWSLTGNFENFVWFTRSIERWRSPILNALLFMLEIAQWIGSFSGRSDTHWAERQFRGRIPIRSDHIFWWSGISMGCALQPSRSYTTNGKLNPWIRSIHCVACLGVGS